MDPAQYQIVREHFLRIRELPEADWQHEIDAIERENAQIATQVRDLLGVDARPSEGDREDLFERAIERGVHDAASNIADAADAGALSAGDTVGAYTVQRKIGEGGFGDVYLASQSGSVTRNVALKVVRHGTQSRHILKRFNQERQALALMNHPNIARFYDASTTSMDLGSRPYFAMEYVQGPTITEYAKRHGLGIARRLELFLKVCSGVQHAHAKGIMHRDLKPSNILVSTIEEPHEPKVIDFGIAKALDQRLTAETLRTEQGQLIGTLAYMSPEQAAGQEVDTRSDVYSLGVVLYELLTGTLPIDPKELAGMPPMAAQKRICESKFERPSTRISSVQTAAGNVARDRVADARALRSELDWIVMRCLEKDPGQRYTTPDALAQDIRRYLEGQPVWARPPSTAYQVKKFVRRNKVPVASASILLLGMMAASVTVIVVLADRAELMIGYREVQAETQLLQEQADEAVARANLAEERAMEAEAVANDAEARAKVAEAMAKDAELRAGEAEARANEVVARANEQERAAKDEAAIAMAQAEAAREEAESARAHADAARSEAADAIAEADAKVRDLEEESRKLAEEFGKLDEEYKVLVKDFGDIETAKRIADENVQRYKTLYEDTERSVGVLTDGSRIPTNALRLIVEELGSQGVLQGEIYEHLARRVFAEGKFEEAVRMQELATRAILRSKGSDDPRTVESQLRLVDLLQKNGQYEQAAKELDEIRVVLHRSFLPGNPDHPLFDQIDLIRVTQYTDTGQHALAYDLANALVKHLEARHGPSDLTTLAAVRRRALVYRALGSIGAEENDYRRVLAQRRDPQTREQAEDLIVAQHNLAMIKQRRGDAQAAELNLERALMRARNTWGIDDWRTAMIQANHANVLAMLGNFPDAQRRFEAAYETLASTIGPSDAVTRQVAKAIVQMYENWNAHLGSTRHNGQIRRWQAVLDETGGS